MLQERMQAQKAEDDALPKPGGSRWKSARSDKGTVLSYAKDVQDKHRKKVGYGDPALLQRTNNPQNRQANRTSDTLESSEPKLKSVENWTISDVTAWLNHLKLSQYVESFAVNEINGEVLLDFSLEDLDYLQITILAHRKIILKGVEELKKNKYVNVLSSNSVMCSLPSPMSASCTNLGDGSTISTKANSQLMSRSLQASPRTGLEDGGITDIMASRLSSDSNAASTQSADKEKTGFSKGTHWSHLEPLSSNKVSNAGHNVNAAGMEHS